MLNALPTNRLFIYQVTKALVLALFILSGFTLHSLAILPYPYEKVGIGLSTGILFSIVFIPSWLVFLGKEFPSYWLLAGCYIACLWVGSSTTDFNELHITTQVSHFTIAIGKTIGFSWIIWFNMHKHSG